MGLANRRVVSFDGFDLSSSGFISTQQMFNIAGNNNSGRARAEPIVLANGALYDPNAGLAATVTPQSFTSDHFVWGNNPDDVASIIDKIEAKVGIRSTLVARGISSSTSCEATLLEIAATIDMPYTATLKNYSYISLVWQPWTVWT